MIVWLNGPFGAGKSATTREIVTLQPDAATFDPEEVGFMLKHALGSDFPGGDFQELLAWRRVTVTALAALSEQLGRDIVVPQSVLVESHWDDLNHGLSQSGIESLAFTLHAEAAELTRRITADDVLADAAPWRLDHRAVYNSAVPWLREKTIMIDTTTLTPAETAERVLAALPTRR